MICSFFSQLFIIQNLFPHNLQLNSSTPNWGNNLVAMRQVMIPEAKTGIMTSNSLTFNISRITMVEVPFFSLSLEMLASFLKQVNYEKNIKGLK